MDDDEVVCPACGEASDSYEVFVEWHGQCPYCGEHPDEDDWHAMGG